MAHKIKKSLSLLWAAQFISITGDSIYELALIWLVLDITGSSVLTGFVAMSAYLPAIIFGLVAGVLADRYHRIFLMLFSNLMQAVTVLIIPLLMYYKVDNVYLIALLAFIRTGFSTIFPPAFNAYIPSLFSRDSLVKVNSFLQTSGQLAFLTGPAIAGILLGFISLGSLFIIDGTSFLIALVILFFVPRKNPIPNALSQPSTLNELFSGLKYLKQQKAIRFMLGLTVINNLFIMGPAIIGTPILVKQVLNGSAADYAFVAAFMALGMLLGSYTVYRIRGRINNGSLLLIGTILDGITYSFLFWANSIPMVMVLILIHGIGIPMITISRTIIIQTHVSKAFHGRLFSMVHLSVIGMTALSAGLVGIVADFLPITVIFLSIGIGAALCGVVGFFNKGLTALS